MASLVQRDRSTNGGSSKSRRPPLGLLPLAIVPAVGRPRDRSGNTLSQAFTQAHGLTLQIDWAIPRPARFWCSSRSRPPSARSSYVQSDLARQGQKHLRGLPPVAAAARQPPGRTRAKTDRAESSLDGDSGGQKLVDVPPAPCGRPLPDLPSPAVLSSFLLDSSFWRTPLRHDSFARKTVGRQTATGPVGRLLSRISSAKKGSATSSPGFDRSPSRAKNGELTFHIHPMAFPLVSLSLSLSLALWLACVRACVLDPSAGRDGQRRRSIKT